MVEEERRRAARERGDRLVKEKWEGSEEETKRADAIERLNRKEIELETNCSSTRA